MRNTGAGIGICKSLDERLFDWGVRLRGAVSSLASDERGQGTTEYAILVGVLVVIAILAITVFKGKIQELWTAISNGIMGL